MASSSVVLVDLMPAPGSTYTHCREPGLILEIGEFLGAGVRYGLVSGLAMPGAECAKMWEYSMLICTERISADVPVIFRAFIYVAVRLRMLGHSGSWA